MVKKSKLVVQVDENTVNIGIAIKDTRKIVNEIRAIQRTLIRIERFSAIIMSLAGLSTGSGVSNSVEHITSITNKLSIGDMDSFNNKFKALSRELEKVKQFRLSDFQASGLAEGAKPIGKGGGLPINLSQGLFLASFIIQIAMMVYQYILEQENKRKIREAEILKQEARKQTLALIKSNEGQRREVYGSYTPR